MKFYGILLFLLCLHTTSSLNFIFKWFFKRSVQPEPPREGLCSRHFPPKSAPQVFLTVSSFTNLTSQRLLEVNWYNADPQAGDWVGLFDVNPTDYRNVLQTKALHRVEVTEPSGFSKSTVSFPKFQFNKAFLRPERCLGFWIAYVNERNKILASECFHTNPDWMWKHKKQIEDFKLWELLIPGTHDAGSYQKNATDDVRNIITRYTYNQDENFFNMLIYGIRYFDLRIAYSITSNVTFWLIHGIEFVNPLQDALEDLQKFLKSNNEIIILDFHELKDFLMTKQHEKLLDFVKQYIGDYLLPDDVLEGQNITLKDIWKRKKKVIAFYNNNFAKDKIELWPGLRQKWGNKQAVPALKSYLENIMNGPTRTYVWPAMTELTPDAAYIAIHTNSGIWGMADQVNRNLTQWVRDLWWDKANIVAMDFFLGSNVINEAISANLKRKWCREKMNPLPSVRMVR